MRAVAFIMAAALAMGGVTPAAAQAARSAERTAYTQSLQCFVANNHAKNRREGAGDPTGAARYEASARRSFDAAMALGRSIGLSNRQMNADIGRVSGEELTRIAESEDYFRGQVATCRGLGLM